MLLHMYELRLPIYVIGGLCILGLLSKLVLLADYRRLVKEAEHMGQSRNKLMKNMRLRFEASYQVKLGVYNVDTFVDKYVYSHKCLGISLYTWENIGGQLMILCGLLSIFASGGAYFLNCGQDVILSTIAVGGISVLLLLSAEVLFNIPVKRMLLRIHIKDYLENTLKAKYENEYFTPEELEAYHKSYFEEEEEDRNAEGRQRRREAYHDLSAEEMAAAEDDQEKERIIEEILQEYLA